MESEQAVHELLNTVEEEEIDEKVVNKKQKGLKRRKK